MSYLNLKRTLYAAQTILGLFLVGYSPYVYKAPGVVNAMSAHITAWIMLAVGLTCILFGITTLILRHDEDIWR